MRLYRLIPESEMGGNRSCLKIPSTYGCVEENLYAVTVEKCSHNKYDPHWVTGPCRCQETHPVTKRKGRWIDHGEYTEVTWKDCDHEWCPGAT